MSVQFNEAELEEIGDNGDAIHMGELDGRLDDVLLPFVLLMETDPFDGSVDYLPFAMRQVKGRDAEIDYVLFCVVDYVDLGLILPHLAAFYASELAERVRWALRLVEPVSLADDLKWRAQYHGATPVGELAA